MNAFDDFKPRFVRLSGMLRRRGRRAEEAEDLVQEAFVRLLTYIEKGEKVLEPEAFLARATYNLSVDRQRRDRAHLYDKRPVEEFRLPDFTPGPEEEAESEQCLQSTRTLLDQALGERARRVFFLHCFEGLTYPEIARQINMSARTVEKDIAKAINILAVHNLERMGRS
jgi:RNA polymerase sigma-70 factor (ECF subfamily)